MAAAYLPSPGSEYGPCEGECEHAGCSETRADAAAECHFCGEEIGYERGFVREQETDSLVHFACILEHVEATR